MSVGNGFRLFLMSLLGVAFSASASPDLDALPRPAGGVPADVGAIAEGFSRIVSGKAAQGANNGTALLVFVSLDMPQPTLERLLDQASRAKARVLIRGFKNGSLRETVARVQALIGTRKAGIQVDPRAFDRFSVVRVPTFVLTHADAGDAPCAGAACAAPVDSVRVAGDVSLEYALDAIGRASPALRADADRYLARLKP